MGTLFLRFGGCNLRCPGWPCDTQYAILPKYRDEWRRTSPSELAGEVIRSAQERNVTNVCLTGGEPFIQNHGSLRLIVEELLAHDISVEAFSNGQVAYPDWAFELVNFVMDWKLQGSGNPASRTTTWDLFTENIQKLKPTDAIKFVIKDDADFAEALNFWDDWEDRTLADWWAGVVWDNGKLTEARLSEMILEEGLPWHLNVQTHKYLWAPEERGV
jgi:7-carboxy-7-deazaguanine synthase